MNHQRNHSNSELNKLLSVLEIEDSFIEMSRIISKLRGNVWEKQAKSEKAERSGSAKLFHTNITDTLKFALEVFWYRRCEIHSPSTPQLPVFMVNLTQIWWPAKTVNFSGWSSCFVPDINEHKTCYLKPEMYDRSTRRSTKSVYTSQSTPFSFEIPIFRIYWWARN